MTAEEMFESLEYEKEDKYHITYTSKNDNHRTFSFYKESPNLIFTTAYILTSKELKACLQQIQELEEKIQEKENEKA